MESIMIFLIYVGVILIIFILPYIIKSITMSLKYSRQKYISLEAIPTEFEGVYDTLYEHYIYPLESMRELVKWRIVIQHTSFIIFIASFIFSNLNYTVISSNIDFLISLTSIGIAITFFFMNIKFKKEYVSIYKNEVVANFIKLINTQLDYKVLAKSSNYSVPQLHYKAAGFELTAFHRLFIDDCIEGYLNNDLYINMYDTVVQSTNSNSGELFHGIFAYMDYVRDIGTSIKIIKDKKTLIKNSDRIETDNEDFERLFDVYSENKSIATQLITGNIMDTLLDFQNKYDLKFEIIFKNKTMYMRFFTGEMFEPKVFGNTQEKNLLLLYFCILKFIMELNKKVNRILETMQIS